MIHWWWLFLVPLFGFWGFFFTHKFYVGVIQQLNKDHKESVRVNERSSYAEGYKHGKDDGRRERDQTKRYQF